MVLFLGTDDKCHIIPVSHITDPFDDKGFRIHTDTKIIEILMFDSVELAKFYFLRNFQCDLIVHS
jgi:hypothetical protein